MSLTSAVIGAAVDQLLTVDAANALIHKVVGGAKAFNNVGWRYAAAGGKLVKGMFVWFTPNGTLDRFIFQMNPEALDEVISPEWASRSVPGQNRPLYQFVNGGPRQLTFTLHFFYEKRDRYHIKNDLERLRRLTQRSMEVPVGAFGGPPAVFFYFGDYIRGDRFIVSRLEIKAFDLFDPTLLLPLRAEATITLLEAPDTTEGALPNVRFRDQVSLSGAVSVGKALLGG